MNTRELIIGILKRLERYKLLIIAIGILCGGLMFFYAKKQRPVYTAKATIFPLTNTSENSLSSNTLSGILGLGDAPKSFSNEAAINIIELTLSRFVRESVASEKLPAFANKTVTEILVNDFNSNKPFLADDIKLPADSLALAILGAEMLKPNIVGKMNKNGVLELYFSHTNKNLISPISYVLIDKLSQFYIDLKIKKAKADYEFTVKKIDSIEDIISGVDRKAIRMQNTTLFAPDKLEYDIPRERINSDKQRYVRQRDISLNNQEEALWRLQKSTPIISVLDKPTEPFAVSKISAVMYCIVGLITGCFFAVFIAVAPLLTRYARSEIRDSLLGAKSHAAVRL
ncbi:MAG: Wzz/FepE/Etk N-terminal domain-containing protein [Ferruginibacter sp.]